MGGDRRRSPHGCPGCGHDAALVTAENGLELRSSEAGAFLTIQREAEARPRDDLEDGYWIAALSCGALHASLRFYEIALGGLVEYFDGLAADWRGWGGERRWTSLEDDLELVATHDGVGTITLKARLATEAFAVHRWMASAELVLDAGALDRIAREVRRLL